MERKLPVRFQLIFLCPADQVCGFISYRLSSINSNEQLTITAIACYQTIGTRFLSSNLWLLGAILSRHTRYLHSNIYLFVYSFIFIILPSINFYYGLIFLNSDWSSSISYCPPSPWLINSLNIHILTVLPSTFITIYLPP